MLIVCVWASVPLLGLSAAVAILAAVGALLALWGVFRPAVGLLGVAMLCPLDVLIRVFLTGGWLPWNSFNYLLLLVMILHVGLLCRRREHPVWLMMLLCGLMTVQLAISPAPAGGVLTILNAASVFGLLVYFVRSRRHPRSWYWLGVVGGTMGACGGFQGMLYGMWMNANAWAYLPLTAMLATCLAFPFAAQYRRGRSLLQLLAAANLCWVYLTGSRGSLLVALTCACFLFVQERRLGRRALAVSVAVFVGLGALVAFSDLQQRALYRIHALFDSQRTLANRTSGRSTLALGAWQLFQRHPLGVGTGGFPRHWARFNVEERMQDGWVRETSAHSAWVMTLAENGLPGILLLIGFVMSFALAGWRRRARRVFPIGVLTTMVLATAFLSTEFSPKGLWMVAAGATVLLYHRVIDRRTGCVVWPPRPGRSVPIIPFPHVLP